MLPLYEPASTLGDPNDPSAEFAAKASALNDLAVQILAAKNAGDSATMFALQAQFRALLGDDNLTAIAAQAKAADMPSSALLALADISDTFGKLAKLAPWALGLLALGWVAVHLPRPRRR